MPQLLPLCRYASTNYRKADGGLIDCGNMPLEYCMEHRCDPLKGAEILEAPRR